jgi:hypothetical protein
VLGLASGGAVVRLTNVMRPAVPADLDFGRDAEVSLVEIFWGYLECGELRNGGRRAQSAGLDVFDLVIRDKVLCHATDGERKCFFHETVMFELVRVGEAAYEAPLALFFIYLLVGLGPAEARVVVFPRVLRGCAFRPTVSSASLVRLTIEEKVAEDAARRPVEAIRPALDARLVLVKDEDRA